MISKAWADQKEIREVMLFLHSHGVSSSFAAKIFKQYGQRSISIVKENPYRLAEDIFGIGFITADRIAENLGVEKDSPLHAEAGRLDSSMNWRTKVMFITRMKPWLTEAVRCCRSIGM